MKEAELYLRAGRYDMAEEAMKKAMCEASTRERADITAIMKDLYKRQAQACEMSKRKTHAAEIYEKILRMDISNIEQRDIKMKLLNLYDNLGRVTDYLKLKKELGL